MMTGTPASRTGARRRRLWLRLAFLAAVCLVLVPGSIRTALSNGGGGEHHGKIAFNPASYSVDESCGTVNVTVTRTGGHHGAVHVHYADAGTGSATSGSDYTAITAGTLNWADDDSSAKTITITITDDSLYELDETIDLVLSDIDGDASLGTHHATVTITNDDVAGVTVSKESVDVTEEGPSSDTYTVVLDTQPAADVAIAIDPVSGYVTVDPTGLTFTSADWDDPQTITVTAVDDAVVEGGHSDTIGHTASSDDENYDEIPIADVTANITDNDTAGIIIDPTETSATEGGAAGSYTVRLATEPTGPVTVSLLPDDQVTIEPTSLTFYPESYGDLLLTADGDRWDDPQTVTVTAVDDNVAEGAHHGIIKHSVESEDEVYDGIGTDDVTVDITDNDAASVIVRPLTVNVAEGGATDTYQICLATEPTGIVTISISPDSQVTVEPTILHFFPGSDEVTALTIEGIAWNEPQTVTVTAVDDAVVEGPHHGHISHSADGGGFDGIEIAGVLASVTDNDKEVPKHEEKVCCSPPGLSGPFITLVDMDGHWAEDVASLMVRLRVMSALPVSRFNPDGSVTRAEFVQMLARTMGCPSAKVRVPFKDVRSTDWFYADLMRQIKNGVVRASDGPAFRPNAPITREETAVMVARALIHCGRPEVVSDLLARQILERFRDAQQIADDNLRTVALAVYSEMIIGRTPRTFMPSASLSRAEAAQALARLWRSLRAH